MPSALNVPNAITLARFALVPVLAWALLEGEQALAFALFVVSALSDAADGLIARHWNLRTRFGAVADPLADKLTMLTVGVLLAWQGALPWWFVLAVMLRDAVIVGGALTYHLWIGSVEMAPRWLSKLNTGLEFALLLGVLAIGAGYGDDGAWRDVLLAATLATIVASGADYVLVWSRKAAQARRAVAPR
ncbi:MAG: CDP-alcohol phosphatidyltransferase family protein [Burkholderiaceae bacterium]|nr:CDP-alcohol phosphatidyltransferase family protein [Burkholderiaceae bacterium]